PALVALISAALLTTPIRAITSGGAGPRLIPVLKDTGLAMLAWSVLTGAGLAVS
ncbi:MAG TPA: 1,4-dihydroxy-2-naphthoate polyprenyltransferase, partial [Amycolatopsis sp.]|nr:1,4-dihydroxy-2-naphthoate polyprenyltransferase [Amycolatopsis sp.]